MGTLYGRQKHNVSLIEKKDMEFSLPVGDILFFVFCKFEIHVHVFIFKIVQVMTENIHFVFLYVLCIYQSMLKPLSHWNAKTGDRE